MAMDRAALAQKLRQARENCGISQKAAADHVGLSRTVIAQIELGNRPVGTDELSKLAGLYRRSLAEFSGEAEPAEDEVLAELLTFAPELEKGPVKLQLQSFLSLCRESIALERSLSRPARIRPPHYDLAAPRNIDEAIAQGERVAVQERQRLGLGAGLAIGSVSDLIASQGVRISAMEFPEEILGLFVRHRSVGLAIILRREPLTSWQRFGLVHEYAHALFERGRTVMVMSPQNSDELVEVRAKAFAAAFLLPSAGIEELLYGIAKGGPSRKAHTLFDLTTEDPIRAEVRSAPGSQTVTYHDVVTVARKFGTSYMATVFRLQGLGVISAADSKNLLSAKQQRAAREYEALFTTELESHRRRPSVSDGNPELHAEIVHLALEAYRRKVIDKAVLSALAQKLQIAQLPAAKLLELAEAAR